MNPVRPNPDELLTQVRAEEELSRRGKLKVFFGYAAGVGKTYAMLQAARMVKASGREVVVGYVEPHGRRETEALLEGIECLPTRSVEYDGVVLREFDVDAALKRRPDLLLVDELAHTNVAGSRHSKRWQDVVELLDAGINIWTTLNVQHIESLNDVVGQITGVTVRETVPDHVFDLADELELADVTPEELVERLRQGKVYLPLQAERAIQNFFQKSNLVALRELSLRQAAKRLHSDVESARRRRSAIEPWATADRLLVCVGPSPTTARVIRTAKRVADALDSPWMAVCVERTGIAADSSSASQVAAHLRLAERLGADTVTLTGNDVAESIIDYARSQNVTKLFVGKTGRPRWTRWLRRGVVERLLDVSGDVDVYVIQGKEEARQVAPPPPPPEPFRWQGYVAATAIVLSASSLAGRFTSLKIADANIVMMYLAAVAFLAFRFGRGPAIWASVISVLIFDVCFVAPRWSLTVYDSQYLFTFAVMLAIGLLISTLTSRLRAQLESGIRRERRTLALYRLGKQLSSLSGEPFLVAAAGQHLQEMLGGEIAIYLRAAGPDSNEIPAVAYGKDASFANDEVSGTTAHWVMCHGKIAGRGTDTLPNAQALFVPLTGSQEALGAIAVRVDPMESPLQPERRSWLENCANQLTLAMERDRMTLAASEARIKAEAEEVRNTLLSGVSHDLKTPLAAITGASDTLLRLDPAPTPTQRELLTSISDEATRLNRLLDNVLQISRLDAGAVSPNKQWHLLEEIVGSALRRTKSGMGRRIVDTDLPPDLPLLLADGLLLEQVFVNLLENAIRYTPDDSHIVVKVRQENESLVATVADDGLGLTAGTEKAIFGRYYRGIAGSDNSRGSGLGLAICQAIVRLHQGTVKARNRPEGGAEFVIRLPLADDAPTVTMESEDGHAG